MEVVSTAVQFAFYGVFLAAVWRYLRRRGTLELALVAVFGAVAGLFAAQSVGRAMPELEPLLSPLGVALLLAQPVFVIWLVHLIRPQPRWLLPLAMGAFAVATAGILLPPDRVAMALLFVAFYFALADGAAAVILFLIGQSRHGVARLRLRLAAIATGLFGMAVALASLGTVATPPGEPNQAQLLGQLVALTAGLTYLVVFMPPTWLHNIGQRAIAFDLGTRLVTAPTGTEPEVLWRNFAHAAQALLSATRVQISDHAGNVIADTDARERAAPSSAPADPAAYNGATAVPAPDDAAAAPLAVPAAPSTTIDVTIATDARGPLRLVAHIEGRLLFIEDDLALLRLLGTVAARAVEREEAMVRLAEARRELEASAAVHASEARFRALLETVPNAVLAVDSAGRVVWATGPTSDILGAPVEELTGRSITSLLSADDADVGVVTERSERVRRAEMTGHRLDGATLPVDVAVTAFELDGQESHLYVVADASWRAAANEMRERFLGVLSHELRTPITSIYGGTQLLVGRGERLDAASRDEVLANVAAETERLLRITENLVVLARVERGADFFDFRPVALRPALTELVAREQTFWPQMSIDLRIEPGLPLVAADEDYLTLIMRNLISNAGKYAGPAARVEIATVHEGGEVVVRVSDDGPGLAPADAEHVFDLYYRAADAVTAPGAGIGLFVCRNLVEAMGGRIWAGSRRQGGTEIGFTLPTYVEPGEALPERPVTRPAAREPSVSRARQRSGA